MKDSRLFKILYYILEKGKVTAGELADKLEVSVRTIYRDIDSLSAAGIPIYAIKGKGGGIEIDKEFVLSKSILSEDEKNMIMSSLYGLSSTSDLLGKELLTKLSALFNMKNINWLEVDFNNWQNNKVSEKAFNDIKFAILNKHIISLLYFGVYGAQTKRSCKPVRLIFKGQDWYLYAFCLLRNDFRYFKLSRIRDLEVLPEKFEDNFDDIILKKEIKYENITHIKARFDKRVAFRVYDELALGITKDEGESLYVEIEIPDDYNLYSYIFSFGDAVEVLEPKDIRIKIGEMANKIAKKYNI